MKIDQSYYLKLLTGFYQFTLIILIHWYIEKETTIKGPFSSCFFYVLIFFVCIFPAPRCTVGKLKINSILAK